MRSDPQLPEVFGRSEASIVGLTRHQVASRVRSGHWIVLRRGAFCLRETFEAYPPNRRHLLHAVAARLVHQHIELVESHLTAAARWGLPMPLGTDRPAYLTDGCSTRSTRLDARAVIEVATLFDGDVTQRSGTWITAPARTAADCLRHHDAEISVPVADAALQRGLTSPEAIARVLAKQARWPYGQHGLTAFALVDGRRESWLESFSVVRLTRCGIARAEPQVEVFDSDGTFIARVDLLWGDTATVGEADGAAKYSLGDWSDLSTASADDLVQVRIEAGLRVVRMEKAREDALRSTGLEMARWTTAEILNHLPDVVRRVKAAQARGNPARFNGRLRSTPQA